MLANLPIATKKHPKPTIFCFFLVQTGHIVNSGRVLNCNQDLFSGVKAWIIMTEQRTEFKSDNARNVILNYDSVVYFVNKVNVQLEEGVEKIKAVFHARKAADNSTQDVAVEISKGAYNALIEYARMDMMDQILVLSIEEGESRWCFLSENWLKKQTLNTSNTGTLKAPSRVSYIV
jgi:hypothetical protein